MSDSSTNNKELARKYLSDRGVLEQTATEHHLLLEETPSAELLFKLLRFTPDPLPETVLIFPSLVWDAGKVGIDRDSYSIRCFPPNVYNSKERKFLRTMRNGDAPISRPYILPAVWDAVSKLEEPVFIVEKQTVALLLHQVGFAAVAFEGTWGAGQPQSPAEKVQKAKRTLHRDLMKFSWIGRTVFLGFDSDFTKKESVLEGMIRTFILFTIAGAIVKVLRWDNVFKGLDDYVAHKAGLDIAAQKQVLNELLSPLEGLDAKASAATWIIPQYRPLFEREGAIIEMSAPGRNHLAHLIAKALDVSVGSLEKAWGDTGQVDPDSTLTMDFPPWDDLVEGSEMAEKVLSVIRYHAYLRDEEAWALTCWIFLCALMDHVTILPIAGITSPVKRCGKTNLMGVLARLCRKALPASGISAAGIYRTISLCKPTLLIDEADTFLPENEELRGLLNSGHTTENAFKILINTETLLPEKFSTFCPKAIALIGELPDTLTDRAIQFKMSRKPRGIKTVPVRKVSPAAHIPLVRAIRRWVEDNWQAVQVSNPKLPAALNDRAAENWEVLAQIAAVWGGEWPARIFKAATLIGGEDDSEGQMLGIYLLYSLRALFREKSLHLPANRELTLPSDFIRDVLNRDSHAPWADWGKGEKKGITTKKLGVELRKFQVRPVKTQIDYKDVRGYRWVDLEPKFKEFLDDGPPEPGSETPPPAADRTEHTAPGGENDASIRRPAPKSNSDNDFRSADSKNQSAIPADHKTQSADLKSFTPSDLGVGRRIEVQISGGEPCSLPFSVISTPEALLAYIDALPDNLSRIALDLETYVPGEEARGRKPKKGEDRQGTALDWQAACIRRISLSIPGGETIVIDLSNTPEGSIRSAVQTLLERLTDVEILGHCLGFDLCFLEHEFGWRPVKVWDSGVAAELLFNDDWELCDKALRPKKTSPGPTALGKVFRRFLGVELDKGLGGGALSDWGVPELSAAQYAYSAGDVHFLPALLPVLESALQEAELGRIASIEMALVPVMSHMEIVGIPLRADVLDAELATLKDKTIAIDSEIEAAMRREGFDPTLEYSKKSKHYLQPPKKPKPLNLNSTNLKEAYFERVEQTRGLRWPRTEKTQHMSMTLEVLKTIDNPVAALYAARLGLAALSGGIEQRRRFVSPDGRVHPIHDQMSANTGRISTEEPAMSNLPKGGPLRGAVEAPLGLVLLQGDLSQIEPRAQAHFTGDPNMIEHLRCPPGSKEHDLYRIMAHKMTGHPILSISTEERNRAKPVQLGKPYFMGSAGFIRYAKEQYGVIFTQEEAERVDALFFEAYPGIKEWHEKAWAQANAGSITEGRTRLGRRRLVLALEGDDSYIYRAAQAQVNYLIQGSCADGLKISLILIHNRLPEGAELILSIHDEILVLCRREQVEEVGKIVQESVVQGYTIAFGIPLKVPIFFEVKPLQRWSEK